MWKLTDFIDLLLPEVAKPRKGGIILSNDLSQGVSDTNSIILRGVFQHWASPKRLKYGKPRLGESTLT